MHDFALGLSPPVHIQVPIQDFAGVICYPKSRFPGICALCQCDEYNANRLSKLATGAIYLQNASLELSIWLLHRYRMWIRCLPLLLLEICELFREIKA